MDETRYETIHHSSHSSLPGGLVFVYLSKFVPYLIYPAGIITILVLIGLLFCRSARSKNSLLRLILLFVFIAGNKLPGAYLIRKLEQAYPVYDGTEKADAIVVLGGGTVTKADPRPTVEVNGAGDRILYAAKLYRENAADLIVVGGSYITWRDGEVFTEAGVSSPASEMADLMINYFDVPRDALIIQDRSVNTYEEAVEDAKLLKERGLNRILLVSSATHMRRAVPLFEKQGLEVIPAPTDFSFSDQEWENLMRFDKATAYTFIVPTVSSMETLQNALKEYLGYFVYHLRGWI